MPGPSQPSKPSKVTSARTTSARTSTAGTTATPAAPRTRRPAATKALATVKVPGATKAAASTRTRAARATAVVPREPVTYAGRPWLTSYPAGVPQEYDFPKVPLTRLLDDAAGSFPDHVALAFLGAKTTYKELKAQVDAFAAVLSGLGVVKGDRVALVLPNCPQNVVAFFGALRLGAVVVEHNPLYTEAELRHQLADCGAKVVVCLDRVHATVVKVQADTAVEKVVVTSVLDALPTASRLKLSLPIAKAKKRKAEISAAVPKDVLSWTDLMKKAAKSTATMRQVAFDPLTDLALLQYTGGTTGLSRGAMLTHHNLVSNAYMNRLWDTEGKAGKEVTLAVLPLFHAYGLTVAMTNTILLGGTLVLLPRFDLDQVFEAIDRWGPTLFPGVPPIYKAIADSPKAKQHDLKSIRLCVSGAMRLPIEVAEQFRKISGAVLVEGYGLTETSPSTHANPTTGPGRPGSIGLPLPGTLCKVVDQADSSVEVPVGQPGELAIKGPQVFSGYWGQDHQDGVFTADGYVLTGDVAVMDDEGWFSIVDRKKELIIAGGFNIYPSEIEAVLAELDGVADAVVVGVPDKYRGETVKAYVVKSAGATLTEQDVIGHAAASLTAYKVPKLVEFRDELPRSAVGKVLRRVLVAEEAAKLEDDTKPASTPGGAAKAKAAKAAGAPVPVAAAAAPATAARTTTSRTTTSRTTTPTRTTTASRASKAPAKKAPPVELPSVEVPLLAPAASEAAVTKRPAAAKKKAPVVKAPVVKAPVVKAPVVKAPAAKTTVTKAPVAKAPVAKKAPAPAAKVTLSKAPVSKAPATRAPAKKTAVKKAAVKKAPAKKAAVKKAPVTKA